MNNNFAFLEKIDFFFFKENVINEVELLQIENDLSISISSNVEQWSVLE